MTHGTLPEGVVTFVFTDVEGSTRLLQTRPDDFAFLLEAHDKVVRACFEKAGGIEVNSEGDGFFWAFGSATKAITGAADLQRAMSSEAVLADAGVKVRIGMTTGQAQLGGRDYVGLVVHHAARVSGAAHGGQILITAETRDAAGDPPDVEMVSMGEHLLKDLARPLSLFQIAGDGMERVFPPLRGLEQANLDGLPATRTSFVGREKELADLASEFGEAGLITLIGPGGTGKTRLALEAARDNRAAFEAIWFADLQAVREPDRVSSAVVKAIDPRASSGGMPLPDEIVARIGSRPCLLIMDNCEQVMDGVADLIEKLVDGCRRLTILATSRELFGLDYERALRTPALNSDEAVELFRARANRAAPDLDLTDRKDQVGRICESLDRIPLAVELAAARTRHLSLDDIEERLSDRFALLSGRRSSSTGGRHETLRSVVEWSHDLLDEPQRALFSRTGAFAGSFDSAAMKALAAVEPSIADPTEVLSQLVDRSLVEHDSRGRYRLLESLRALASERLEAAVECADVRIAHSRYFSEVMESLDWGPGGNQGVDGPGRVRPDLANIELALEQVASSTEPEHRGLALRLSAASVQIAGTLGSQALQEAAMDVSLPDAEWTDLRKRAVLAACTAPAPATQAFQAAEPLMGTGSEPIWRAMLQRWEALKARSAGKIDKAVELFDLSAEAAAEADNRQMQVCAEAEAAFLRFQQSQLEESRRRFDHAIALSEGKELGHWDAVSRFWAAMAESDLPEGGRANRYYNEALDLYRRLGIRISVHWILEHLSRLNLLLGNVDEARAYAEEGVRHSLDNNLGMGSNLEGMYAVLGLTEELREDFGQAIHYFQKALDLKPFDQSPNGHVFDLCRLVSVWSRAGEPDIALDYLSRAVELIPQVEPQKLVRQTEPVPWGALYLAASRWALAAGMPHESAALFGAARAIKPHGWDVPVMIENRRQHEESLAETLGGSAQFEAEVARGEADEAPFSVLQELVGAAGANPTAP